ncbi:hypothetical protein EVAR_18333_1 [Eumeta japonica]|uniref:Uncharacterized protein n=1 Tax=Eumeta variegata TaxID=151549 RepID=A0A4C1V8K7_EUMVA|nr:hypothetical protein EVAR_18333_1 [Eumeta japonica]
MLVSEKNKREYWSGLLRRYVRVYGPIEESSSYTVAARGAADKECNATIGCNKGTECVHTKATEISASNDSEGGVAVLNALRGP